MGRRERGHTQVAPPLGSATDSEFFKPVLGFSAIAVVNLFTSIPEDNGFSRFTSGHSRRIPFSNDLFKQKSLTHQEGSTKDALAENFFRFHDQFGQNN